jgi:hypothetical protein
MDENGKDFAFQGDRMQTEKLPQVYFALEALEKTLSSLDHKFEPGSGLKAAEMILEDVDSKKNT